MNKSDCDEENATDRQRIWAAEHHNKADNESCRSFEKKSQHSRDSTSAADDTAKHQDRLYKLWYITTLIWASNIEHDMLS